VLLVYDQPITHIGCSIFNFFTVVHGNKTSNLEALNGTYFDVL
jgi:hypothetical protein